MPKGVEEWIAKNEHCDLIDIDIQDAELEILGKAKHSLDKHVYRVIGGTHSAELHQAIRTWSEDCIAVYDTPFSTDTKCITHALRRNYDPSREQDFRWKEILEKSCFQQWQNERVFVVR